MRADKILTVMAAVVISATVGTVAVAPSANAQAPKVHRHGPVRVTVHKRSFLDPGTETKTHDEHSSDYFRHPADGFDTFQNSTLFNSGPGLPFWHDRMPFPNCLDLAGFCQ